jgi:hypothetical protein
MIEDATSAPVGEALRRLALDPLEIDKAAIAALPSDLNAIAWKNATNYHPGWVFHGLLIGTAASAAMFLHRLLNGRLFPNTLLTVMRTPFFLRRPTARSPLGLLRLWSRFDVRRRRTERVLYRPYRRRPG